MCLIKLNKKWINFVYVIFFYVNCKLYVLFGVFVVEFDWCLEKKILFENVVWGNYVYVLVVRIFGIIGVSYDCLMVFKDKFK